MNQPFEDMVYERPARHGAVNWSEGHDGMTTCRCGFEAPHEAAAAHFRATYDPDADDLPAVQMIRVPDGRVGWTYHCGIADCCPDWPQGAEA